MSKDEEPQKKERTPLSAKLRSGLVNVEKQARPCIIIFLILLVITGVVYPLAVTGVSQAAFSYQANGSKIEVNGTVVGSALIGQLFTNDSYFWGRLSASDYNGTESGGTNLAPSSPELEALVEARVNALHAADPNNTQPIPSDLVTASGSGLDPDISYAAAIYQLPRVAEDQNLNASYVLSLINTYTTTDITGDKNVNVLELNLALYELDSTGKNNPSTNNNNTNVTALISEVSGSPSNTVFLGLTSSDWIYIILFAAILFPLAWLTGNLITQVYQDDRPEKKQRFGAIRRSCRRIENWVYSPAKVDRKGMTWKTYLFCILIFNGLGFLVLMLIMMIQGILPLNPEHLSSVSPGLAFQTAVSFVTNTNWQSYPGETTMSYFTQMVGLTVQNFLSAATGLAVLIALIRGIRNRSSKDLGNFWVDMTRATMILLPIVFVISLVLVSQGTVQTLNGPITAQLIDPHNGTTTQLIAVGPVASQEAIKLLGTNGGGFFNANSAHPFENPTLLTNLIETITVLLIPVGLCFSYGRLVGDKRQGIAILIVMLVLFSAFAGVMIWAEEGGNTAVANIGGVSQMSTPYQPGGNMEGKELRFGVVPSALFDTTCTATSCGAVIPCWTHTRLLAVCPLLR